MITYINKQDGNHSYKDYLDKDGVFVVENYLNKAEVEKYLVLHKKIENNAITNNGFTKKELDPGFMAKYKRGSNIELKAIDNFFSADWMRNLSKEYYAKNVNLNTEIHIGLDKAGTKHIAQDLHFDVLPTLKYFLYINDVNNDNGAFSCVPKSHRFTKQIRAKNANIDFDSREITREHNYSEAEIIPVEGSAGSLIIFTTEVWHKAGTVVSGERRIMRGHTRPSSGFTEILKKIINI